MSQYIQRIDHDLPAQGVGPTLYKLDSTGRLRMWCMELDTDGGMYRTLAGLANGKQAVSGWTAVQARSQNTDAEQARFEVLAQYDHQLNREYHLTADTVSQPKMIEPMLAKTYDKWPGRGYAQPKLDGIRCIADVNGLWTRQGQPIIAVPHIHAALAPLFAANPDIVLDGELYNHDLREDFGAISSIVRKKNPTAEQLELADRVMQYHVYDMVDPTAKFSERMEFVRAALAKLDCGWIIPVRTWRCDSPATPTPATATPLKTATRAACTGSTRPTRSVAGASRCSSARSSSPRNSASPRSRKARATGPVLQNAWCS